MIDRPKVYLAGPGVFRPNAKEIGEELKAICARNGLEGIFPLDAQAEQTSIRGYAMKIFNANCLMIRDAAAVIADISSFRGPHMDCGTAWEAGFAIALDKPTFAYVNLRHPGTWFHSDHAPRTVIGRIWCEQTETGWRDAHGDTVEDFDLVENLMIGCSVESVSVSAEQAIHRTSQHFKRVLT